MEPRAVPLKPDWLGQQPDLPWSWATERLQRERNYWLASIKAGRPQARPVWGLWEADLLLLSLGGGGVRRTEALDGQPVTAHTDSAVNVVIVEGHLVRIANDRVGHEGLRFDDAVLQRMIEAWNAKYDRGWTPDHHGFNFAVRPEVVLAWREDQEAHSADASAKWRFD